MKKSILTIMVFPILLLSFLGCDNKYDHEKMTDRHMNDIYKKYQNLKKEYSYVDFIFDCHFSSGNQTNDGSFKKGENYGIRSCVFDVDEDCLLYHYQYDLFYFSELDYFYNSYLNKTYLFESGYVSMDFYFSLDNYLSFDITFSYDNGFKANYIINYDEYYMLNSIEKTNFFNDELTTSYSLKISYR